MRQTDQLRAPLDVPAQLREARFEHRFGLCLRERDRERIARIDGAQIDPGHPLSVAEGVEDPHLLPAGHDLCAHPDGVQHLQRASVDVRGARLPRSRRGAIDHPHPRPAAQQIEGQNEPGGPGPDHEDVEGRLAHACCRRTPSERAAGAGGTHFRIASAWRSVALFPIQRAANQASQRLGVRIPFTPRRAS